MSYVTFGKVNPKVLLITGPPPSIANHADPRLALPLSGFSTYDVASASPNSLSPPAVDLNTVSFTQYDVILVASDFGGWLSQPELNILISRKQQLFDFINAGGGIVALAETGPGGPYTLTSGPAFGFLPFVLSGAALNQFDNGNSLTAAGTTLGLTNADINGNASHCIFTGSSGLDIIDHDPKGEILSLATRGVPIGNGGPTDTLKVCKVAGPGVAPGAIFSFTVGSTSLDVAAGTCKVAGSFPVGLNVAIHEVLAPGSGVTVGGVTVAPPDRLVGTPDLANGNATVTIGRGVTEVTYTNKKTGFLEICKNSDGPLSGNFTFNVNPGGLGPFVIPVGSCSPAIEVAAGSVTINESFSPGTILVGCDTIPATQQGPCDRNAQSSTVTVAPGDISTQTIASVTNRAKAVPGVVSHASAPTTVGGAVADTATLSGGSNPSGTMIFRLYGPDDATCSAPVIFTASIVVNGNGNYSSPPFQPTTPGVYRWVVAYSGDPTNGAVSGACNDANEATTVTPKKLSPCCSDYDGDGKGDIAVYRPSSGTWFIHLSTGGDLRVAFGVTGDIPVPRDYDGDGKTDIAVFRPSTGQWFLHLSTGGDVVVSFGVTGDIPVPRDYDGDGKADLAVFRPSTGVWYIKNSSGGTTATAWGTSGDIPVPCDCDGDGKADLVVFRPSTGTWYAQKSAGGTTATAWGANGDRPLCCDFDGDGKADIAVYRPSTGTWYIKNSSGSPTATAWGAAGDIPVPCDYDGDGKADVAVFRPSTGMWYIKNSSAGTTTTQWGFFGDTPV